MNMEAQRNKLNLPLPPMLMDYIMHEYPQTGPIIVSTVEYTIKESRNHYMDVMRALEPLLKDNTKAFVDKLFMFRKRMCRDGTHCNKHFCLFAHNDDELVPSTSRKSSTADAPLAKKPRLENNEVAVGKLDEDRHTVDDLRDFCQKHGAISSIRTVSRGRYVVVFEDSEAARRLVESTEPILGDPQIKKQLNMQGEQGRRAELAHLLDDQQELLDGLTNSFDTEMFEELKDVTLRIRKNVLSNDSRVPNDIVVPTQQKQDDYPTDIESSLYYNMFAK